MFRKALTQNTHSIKILGIVFKSAVVMEYVSYGAYVLDRRYSKKKNLMMNFQSRVFHSFYTCLFSSPMLPTGIISVTKTYGASAESLKT